MEHQPLMIPKGFYPEFRDGVESFRQSRGVLTARWDDVWVVATETPQTSRVLREQGVYSSTLARDLRFSLHFGRPDPIGDFDPTRSTVSGVHREASAELLSDIEAYVETQTLQSSPEGNRAGVGFMRQLRRYLRHREQLLDDPDSLPREKDKLGMTKLAVEGFLAQMGYTSETRGGGMSHLPDSYAAAEKLATFKSFAEYLQLRSALVTNGEQPLIVLDHDNKAALINGGLTPFQLVERAKELADPFLQYALFRNGLAAPADYQPPYRMPDVVVTNHALSAFNYVKGNRETTVSHKHLLPSLLEDPEVHAVIRELDKNNRVSDKEDPNSDLVFGFMFGGRVRPGRNFIKFNAAVRAAISPADDSGERFYHHPVIDEGLKEFLYRATEVVSKGPEELAEARLFGELLKIPEVQEVLIKAGLTKAQLAKWPRTLINVEKKIKDDQKVGEKKKEPFKVDERELDRLLEQYAVDRTKLALAGKLDPLVGREQELTEMVQILLQRGRSNPLLLGEPGVGKTALFNGLAQLIASGKVPKELIGARVLSLDLGSMNSGAMYRGQFEGRLLPIIEGIAERNERGDTLAVELHWGCCLLLTLEFL